MSGWRRAASRCLRLTMISLTISTLEQLKKVDLRLVSRVYAGNPLCLQYPKNLLTNQAHLREAAKLAADNGVDFFITTPLVVTPDLVDPVRDLLSLAEDIGVQGVEFTDLAIWKIAPANLSLHCGPLLNITSNHFLDIFANSQVKSAHPCLELSLDQIGEIYSHTAIDLEITVFGFIILAVAPNCHWLDQKKCVHGYGARPFSSPGKARYSRPDCNCQCAGLSHRVRWERFEVISAGRGLLSSRRVSMLEHLDKLKRLSCHIFRIEGLYESPKNLAETMVVFAEAILQLEQFNPGDGQRWQNLLSKIYHNPIFCNGFYFDCSGQDYKPVPCSTPTLQVATKEVN